MEDEMVELSLLKTFWNTQSSVANQEPEANVTTIEIPVIQPPTYQVDIKGIMNNNILSDGDKMVGSSAWLTYPISLFDLTKFNFTINWANIVCPIDNVLLVNCSPQGGFAMVFQKESPTQIGEFVNNLGEGIGYEGLSGLFAIEFDTYPSVHDNQPLDNQLKITIQTTNPNVNLLSTESSSRLAENSNPANFASFKLSGFSETSVISVGMIQNQLSQEMLILIDINGIRQLEAKVSFKQIGLDPNRAYYVGFTSSQNVNKNVASATLNINNFRVFKALSKFVDGQVSYIGDQIRSSGNLTILEIRSSFYDLCMQKTTFHVYPTMSIDAWQKGQEQEPRIYPFFNNRDTLVVGSIIENINKPQFYSPSSLSVQPDVKFAVKLPVGVTTNIRMGFYYFSSLIMNITTIDYQKQSNSNYTFLVIDNSDLITSTLSTKGFANNLYQFSVYYYDGNLNPVPVDFSQLSLTVTSDYIRRNETSYSNQVPTTCYRVQSQQSQSTSTGSNTVVTRDPNSASQFTCQFLPNVNGTYFINSPFFPNGRSFRVDIGQADQVNEILSPEFSQAIIRGDFEMNAGSTVEVFLDLRNNLNNTFTPRPEDGCSFSGSFYQIGDTKYSFLFQDEFPFLRTQISKAGVADFKISISCTRSKFDIPCFRCQKIIKALPNYLYYLLSIPAFPSTLDVPLDREVMFYAGNNFVIDITFYDRFDNIMENEIPTASLTDFKGSFVYGRNRTQQFEFLRMQVPGKIMLFLNETQNLFLKQLRARTNYFYLNLNFPAISNCFSLITDIRRVYFIPHDKAGPVEFVGTDDLNTYDRLGTTITWDRVIQVGKFGRMHFVTRNSNGLKMNQWVPTLSTTEFIDPRIQNRNNANVRGSDCFIRFSYGLYEGEYFGLYYCNSGSMYNYINLMINGTNHTTPIPFYVTSGIPTRVEPPFTSNQATVLTLGNGGLNLTFRINDTSNNPVDSHYLIRGQTHLGLITYNLTNIETGIVHRYSVIPMVAQFPSQFRISVDDIPIGRYNLTLNFPKPISTEVRFVSNSNIISPYYSNAMRHGVRDSTINVGSQAIFRLYAKNIHNQAITRVEDQALIAAQTVMYLQSSNGNQFRFQFNGTFFDETNTIYFMYITSEPLRSNGNYKIVIQFLDPFIPLYVQNGTFSIQDNFDPQASDLYLVKGMEQKEFRLVRFETTSTLQSTTQASHYDPRFDGTLKFKLYFRTNNNFELVNNARFNNHQFTRAQIMIADRIDGLLRPGAAIANITLKISNFQDYLIVSPNVQSDQDRIDILKEDYYFITIGGTSFTTNTFQMQWIFSLYNSELPHAAGWPFTLFAPRFINITAGEPFTFMVSAVGLAGSVLNLNVVRTDLLQNDIQSSTGLATPAFHFYVTIYHQKAGFNFLTLQASQSSGQASVQRDITIQVNPGPLYEMQLLNTTQLNVRGRFYNYGTYLGFNFTLMDRYENNILLFERSKPPMQEIYDMIQLQHSDNQPINTIIQIIPSLNMFQVNFTTFYPGVISFVPPILNYTSLQQVAAVSLNATFNQSLSLMAVQGAKSYARFRSHTVQAGAFAALDIFLRDDYANPVNMVQNRALFSINLIPDNDCNASSIVMTFLQQRLDIINMTANITRACTYQTHAYYFSPTEGQVGIPCLNCYLTVTPSTEEIRRIEILDGQDMTVSLMNRMALTINRFDTNPKFIVNFRDWYENFVTAEGMSAQFLSAAYEFDVVQPTSDTILYKGIPTSIKNFHYLQFCALEISERPCFSNFSSTVVYRLRIQQTRGRTIIRQYIPIRLVDNYGLLYNSDDINPVKLSNSYLRILNQDVISSLGYDLPVVPEKCIGGDEYPIIGRLDLKTTHGFRVNQTFAQLQSKISFDVENLTSNQITFLPFAGNTNGIINFVIFVRGDFYLDSKSITARIFFNNELFLNKNITIQCRRRSSFQRFIVSSNNQLTNAFDVRTVQAGSQFNFAMTGADPLFPQAFQFQPYDTKSIAFYYVDSNTTVNNFTIIQDKNREVALYSTVFTQAGQAQLMGPAILDNIGLQITILPGKIHGKYTTIQATSFRIRAGENSTVLINPFDEYGNQITFINGVSEFNNDVQVYFAKYSLMGNELWTQATCASISNGRVSCASPQFSMTEKGLYKWRAIVNGIQAKCVSCYVRVVPSGNIGHNRTILTDLSQNFFSNQIIAWSRFNVQPRQSGLFFKLIITDEFNNLYLGEDHVVVNNVSMKITNNGLDFNLAATKLFPTRLDTGSQFYKFIIPTNRVTAFQAAVEGIYRIQPSIQVGTTTLQPNFNYFIRSNRTSPSYPAFASTTQLRMRFRESQFILTAGKQGSIQFGVFDDNLFLQQFTSANNYSFSIASLSNSTPSNGDSILGPYRFMFERQLILNTVTQSSVTPNQLFMQQYVVNVQVGTSSVTATQFTAVVFPGPVASVQYFNDNTAFAAVDSLGNNVDFNYEGLFGIQVVEFRNRNIQSLTPYRLANQVYFMNYTQRRGQIRHLFKNQNSLILYQLEDTTMSFIRNPFANNPSRGIVDSTQSFYELFNQTITAGQNFTIRVQLLDAMYQRVNISRNAAVLASLSLSILHEGSNSIRFFNFNTTANNNTIDYFLSLQMNISGFHYIQLRFNGITINNRYGPGFQVWLNVEQDFITGVTADSQWQVSLLAIQRNKVFSPLSIINNEYVTFMKQQPLFLLARICDRFGNPFNDPETYDFYNVGDTALSARITQQGLDRNIDLNSLIVYNVMLISASNSQTRAVYNDFVPSYFPVVSNINYNSDSSYKMEIYSPANSTSNIRLKTVFLVLDTDSPISKYHSERVTITRNLLLPSPIISSDFINGEVQLRLNKKQIFTYQVRNSDARPYLSEQITNFSVFLTNQTQVTFLNTSNPRQPVNQTINVTLDTVRIQPIPFVNNAFYRVFFQGTSLYQDSFPLQVRAFIQTNFTNNATRPVIFNMPLRVYPPTPPNFLNQIINTTFLARNQTRFMPASRIQFNLTLRTDAMIFFNDRQSASRIRIYRKSTLEQVVGGIINNTTYTITVNLEGPSRNEFRIFYQDFNGALYPITNPQVIYFEIQSTDQILLQQNRYLTESFVYHKLMPDYNGIRAYALKQQRDLSKVQIYIVPNFINGIYIIGNDFRASILVIDSQSSRCLMESDYNINSDLQVLIYRWDPIQNQTMRVSIDLPFISLVKNSIKQPTSYCAYYSNALLESNTQLNSVGRYIMIATLMGRVTSNVTFNARFSGIDFRQTTVGWYQQPLNSDQLIAAVNAYEEFNYLIFFKDVQGNFVSDRTQFVRIQIKFDGQRLVEGNDYKYISRYDDRFKGYLVTVQFFKAGTFKPEYYFNLLRAESIEVDNGPILFVVYEPQCINVQALSQIPSTYEIGQLFSFSFNCFDINSRVISEAIKGVNAQAVFINLDTNNQQTFGAIDPQRNGIYRISHKFYMQGRYQLKIYFNSLLIYEDETQVYQVQSSVCKDSLNGQLMFRCPNNPAICAYSYSECQYINTTQCPLSASPFACGNNRCVSSMSTQCCRVLDRNLPDFLWCSQTNQCYNSTLLTCDSQNPLQQIFCKAKNIYVRHQFECCEDMTFNVTSRVQNQTVISTQKMVKCSQEDKCVPADTADFCFNGFRRNCREQYGPEFALQCPNDGKCKRNMTECPSPRVCPPGYTMCPDSSCIQGLGKINQCFSLQDCSRVLPDGSLVNFIRCADGSCSKTFDQCPSQISCISPGQVVCPDGSCKNSSNDCFQPLECTSDKPYKCPGFPTVCANSKSECPIPSSKTCQNTQMLCANGECSTDCMPSERYVKTGNNISTVINQCHSQGLIQCPNFECRKSYYECSDTLYCPAPINFTYSPQATICSGAQICSLDQQSCSYSHCSSELNVQLLSSSVQFDKLTLTNVNLETCYDGRCHLDIRQKQDVCMTPISCSFSYFKTGGVGEFCVKKSEMANALMEIGIINNDNRCQKNQFKCVTGECRNSIDDCPSQITCPLELPVQCRDGQCVKSKTQCAKVDNAVEKNIIKCMEQGMLLCTSDLITCSMSQSHCPSRSSCPIGFIKCWDESCIDPQINECPRVNSIEQNKLSSTCPHENAFPFHCFSDGSCRASLRDCPTQTYCPIERPVKCNDGSCRSSLRNCPMISCPLGFKFCPGDSTCIRSSKSCGTTTTCPSDVPFKCEDGQCTLKKTECESPKHKLSTEVISCLSKNNKVVCQNGIAQCESTITNCLATSACTGSNLVKAANTNLCYKSVEDFSEQAVIAQIENVCELNNMYKCANGSCSRTPCFEWTNCTSEIAKIKCWNGQCVQSQDQCPLKSNECPFYAPINCKNSGQCVSQATDCRNETNEVESLARCKTAFNMSLACPSNGNCAQDEVNCIQETQCISLYPNTLRINQGDCFVPQCPPSVPFKCSNGLCVDREDNCPVNVIFGLDIKICAELSNQTNRNLRVPCGNGDCVSSADQCLPLYDCSLNIESQEFFRCSDGACKKKESDCPYNTNKCPSHTPFMCQNGLCALNINECLSNRNGCPLRAPHKCIFNGQCVSSSDQCIRPQTVLTQMFIYPNFIPFITSTPLIAFYGRTRSYCQQIGQFTCKIGDDMPFCVDRLDDCKDQVTNCEVNKPIRCGSRCISNASTCIEDSCSSSQLDKCPSSGGCLANPTLLNQTLNMGAFTACLTSSGCPTNQPFRCNNLLTSTCAALPYTSDIRLQNQTCSTISRQSNRQTNSLFLNDCFSSDTPFSCADGSCVSSVDKCPTCVQYCPNFRICVRSRDDCNLLSTSLQMISQICPISSPFRCITNGLCARDEKECHLQNSVSYKAQYNITFSGSQLSPKCSYQAPILCSDGRCVSIYDDCLSDVRTAVLPISNNSLSQPHIWGAQLQNVSACNVYCQDGSCREKVENCPVIQGCYDTLRPYRCKSGFCARDREQCFRISNQIIESESLQANQSSSCAQIQPDIPMQRCEDGICRPLILNLTTNKYSSTCLPFMGCPRNRPYHCTTGDCVIDKASCAGSSQCPIDKPFRCKNHQCVKKIESCSRPFASYSALQLDVTIDPLSTNEVVFAYSQTGEVLGKLQFISNTLRSGAASTNEINLLNHQRIQIYPVPDSLLDKVKNDIPDTRVEHLQRIYPLQSDNTLQRAYTLLSPAVKIEYNSQEKLNVDTGFISLAFDEQSFPYVLNLEQDTCLGRVVNQDQINEGNAIWQCQTRSFEINDDGMLQYKINQLGIYALIVNPDPDLSINNECGFICQNHQMLLILELTFVGVAGLFIYAFCICCHNKAPQQKLKRDKFQSRIGSQNYMSPIKGGMYNNLMETPLRFLGMEDNYEDMDIDAIKEKLETVDTSDPPLMPGQIALKLADSHDIQIKQIEVLKSQLQEYQEKEMSNLGIIKTIFDKNRILQEQINLQKEISNDGSKPSKKSRRPKKVKEDPSIMSEYNNIDAYLAQSMMGSRQDTMVINALLGPQASQATLQEYPGYNNHSLVHQLQNADNSMMSIPVQNYTGQMIVSESTRDLMTKNYQSAQKLEIPDNSTTNILIRDDEQEQKPSQNLNDTTQHLGMIEEEKDDQDAPAMQTINRKKKRLQGAGIGARISQTDTHAQEGSKDNSYGIESDILSKTLHSIFARNKRGQGGVSDTRAYNMVLGNESITGSVSGTILRTNQGIEPEISRNYQDLVNYKEEDEVTESNSYLKLKELEQLLTVSPSKKKKKTNSSKKSTSSNK